MGSPPPRIIAVSSPLSSDEAVGRVVEELRDELRSIAEIWGVARSIDELPEQGSEPWLGVFVVTGGTEHVILEAVRRSGAPLLIAHERLNSLAASLEALARLREEGYRIRLLVKRDKRTRRTASIYASGLGVLQELRRGLMLLGPPSDWLVASIPAQRVLGRLGIKISVVGLSEVYRRYDAVDPRRAEALLARFHNIEVVEPSRRDLVEALRLYLAIRSLLDDHGASMFSIRCFDVIARLGTTACLSLAMLNSEGYVAGCEGDVVSLIGLALARKVSGLPGFMGNVAVLGEGELVLAHCTVPLAMLSSYKLRTHFESGMGVGVEGVLRPDIKTVTLFRLSRSLDKAHIVLGEVIRSGGWSSHQCRTQVMLRVPKGFTAELSSSPLGNHYVMIVGNRVEEARSFAELLGAEPRIWAS